MRVSKTLVGLAVACTGLLLTTTPASAASTGPVANTGVHRFAASAGGTAQPAISQLSTNWSGIQITRTSGFVQSGWTVPAVTRPIPPYSTTDEYASSTWVGVGGGFNSGNGALIQAGTTQLYHHGGTTEYYAWWEIVGGTNPTPAEVRLPIAIHAHDVVGAVVEYFPTNASTGTAIMGVCNFTSNICVNSGSKPTSTPGTSTEWIVEAPSLNGQIQPLVNFGTITFVNACFEVTVNTTCLPITSGGTTTTINLEQFVYNEWQVLTRVGAISANGLSFPDTYKPAVKPDPCPTC